MELEWALPEKKQQPLYISYSPESVDLSQNFINPFIGYPNCPIIGRYNRGEYKIGEFLFQLQFKCEYKQEIQSYVCGGKQIKLPELMHYNLRNIPEIIINNKAAGIKNSPEILPQRYPVRPNLSVYWIVSFGELGKDFLNYLNHMYILACTLFLDQKLQRMIHFLPIYAYLPLSSGLRNIQVQRGLNFNGYRGEYMSFHLSKGAPAFSPNNMRLGVEGGKLITSKKQTKFQRKPKQKYIEKQKAEQLKIKKLQQKQQQHQQQQLNINWKQMEQTVIAEKQTKMQSKQEKKQFQEANKHQGFIHFYTSVLLQNDYRVYYHWHIEDHLKQNIIKDIWKQSLSVEQFIQKYHNFQGKDPMIEQLRRLLFPHWA